MYGSVSYDLFYSKVDESAGPLVDLTMLDFRITALEVTIGASLPILQPKHEAHSREWVGSMSTVKALLQIVCFSRWKNQRWGCSGCFILLNRQVHDPPNIDPVQQSMENLLAIQKEVKETPIPNKL
ncbi:hypothetical protein BJ741DRAFT_581174 [Chytriomyces cf. hyalinus JEL632]|nr:hypothetical protein BJ741DRAFT_581174 [Chytriomyces cf. hyalinus JEL632]